MRTSSSTDNAPTEPVTEPLPILSATQLSHRYSSLEVIANVSLSLSRGEIVTIMAPSGAGKSTLMRLILGLERPSGGRCACEIPGRQIGLVLQDDNLLPWRTLSENLLLFRRLGTQCFAQDALDEYVHRLGLSEFLNSFPRELSTGMRQKAALCRVLIAEPTLFAIDEGMANIDDLTRFYLCDELRHAVHSGERTVLFITHNPTDALHLSDRILVGTQRPLRIEREFVNPLPRDRDASVRYSSSFGDAMEDLRACLEQH